MGKEREYQPEFSRVLEIESLARGPVHRTIEASPEERAALARRFGLEGLDRLSASLTVEPLAAGMARLRGSLTAEVTQTCVVSLEPVHSVIENGFVLDFAAEEAQSGPAAVDLTLDDEDWPEPLVNGRIDLGEAVAQQLAMALDPYPRAPGATLAGTGDDVAPEDEAAGGPFSRLAELVKSGRQG